MHALTGTAMPAQAVGLAIHVGADVLTSPQHALRPAVRSCRDAIERPSRPPRSSP
jgi:hypothetical protein